MRIRPTLVAACAAVLWQGTAPVGAQSVRVPNLEGQLIDPLAASPGVKATVLVFVSTECPISSRYAPDLRGLAERFRGEGIRFWLVYANPGEEVRAIRVHQHAYGYAIDALRDTDHRLVQRAKATMTSEAAVFNSEGRLVYRGRIDNRFVSLTVERPAPTRHDLADTLTAILAGKPVPGATTQALGCYLADFRP
jgi:hypothetical protein